MTLTKKLLLVNICGIVGVILSLLVIPGSTNFWLWIGSSAVVICLLNLLVLTQQKRKLAGSGGGSKIGIVSLIVSLILTGIALAIQFAHR